LKKQISMSSAAFCRISGRETLHVALGQTGEESPQFTTRKIGVVAVNLRQTRGTCKNEARIFRKGPVNVASRFAGGGRAKLMRGDPT